MNRLKNIIYLFLLLQACSALPYGHPDAEVIEIGSQSSQSSRDKFVIEAAVRRGMDGEAIAELLRTKQPVVKVKVDANGTTTTTTYSIDEEGSISMRTKSERKPVRTFQVGSLPENVNFDELLNSPGRTVTRTYIDNDGSKVTQTVSVGKPRTTVISSNSDDFDWFGSSAPNWINSEFPQHHNNVPQDLGNTNYHRTTTTYSGPGGKKSVTENWSSGPGSHSQSIPNNPLFKWPAFNTPVGDRGEDADSWTVVNGHPDVETIAVGKQPSYVTPKTDGSTIYQRPFQPKATTPLPSLEEFLDTQFIATSPRSQHSKNTGQVATQPTVARPAPSLEDFFNTPVVSVKQPNHDASQPESKSALPSLEDFLHESFTSVSPSKTTHTTTTYGSPQLQPKVTTPLPTLEDFLHSQYIPDTESNPKVQKPMTINIEDIPVTQILYNGKPVDENTLKNLPAHLKPKSGDLSPTPHTRTQSSNSKPSMGNLDPQLKELLQNAGISLDDITNIDGDTITKTHTEPDGSIVTSTFKVRTASAPVPVYEKPRPTVYTTSHSYSSKDNSHFPGTASAPVPVYEKPNPTVYTTSHSYSSKDNSHFPGRTAQTNKSNLSPVAEYLAKVDLTEADVMAKNGEYTKTFIDEDGQVLTATFVLSRPLSQSNILQNNERQKPLK